MSAAERPGPRVLMLGPLPPPVGGMATVIQNLVGALQGPVQVRVLNNVKTTPADRRLWQGVVAQLALLWRLGGSCLIWRPALVHIHTCSRMTFWRNGVDVLLARSLGRRVVLHVHGAQFHHFLGGLGPVAGWAARRIFGLCSGVIVLGEGWKRLLDRWTRPERVVVVGNGVPIPPPLQPDADADFCILCLANYEQRKGQADLLRAVAGLRAGRPVRVALLGFEAEPGQRQALMALAQELGIADRVEIPGPVVGDEKDRWLRSGRCFCLPSYDEGLPMAMLEAMALGLPVVVTAVGSIPEAVDDGNEGLLYRPGDIEALGERLQALVDDPAMAARIAAAGRARVTREFSLEHSAAGVLRLYAALGCRPRSPEHARD